MPAYDGRTFQADHEDDDRAEADHVLAQPMRRRFIPHAKTCSARQCSAPAIDVLVVYVLNGALKYPSVRDRVEALETSLFYTRAERVLAAMVITNQWCVPQDLRPRERAELDAITRAAGETEIPNDEVWAHHITTILAQRRAGPLLADACQWAARHLRAGTLPGEWVRRKLNELISLIDPTSKRTTSTEARI